MKAGEKKRKRKKEGWKESQTEIADTKKFWPIFLRNLKLSHFSDGYKIQPILSMSLKFDQYYYWISNPTNIFSESKIQPIFFDESKTWPNISKNLKFDQILLMNLKLNHLFW